MFTIGIDIGGTTVKAGLIDGTTIVDRQVLKTDALDAIGEVKKVIKDIMNKNKISSKDIKGISIACPGIVKDGVVYASANLCLEKCNIYDEMAKFTSLPVIVKNDADMATIAECKLGAGKGSDNMILLTIGTGIGGGIIIGGKLYEGKGGAGELGHIPFIYGGKPCGCGNRGCIEKYASCIALTELAKEMVESNGGTSLTISDCERASEIEKHYLLGDSVAVAIVEEYTDRLVQALTAYCNIFRPDKIVLGGGIVNAPQIISVAIDKLKRLDYGYKNGFPVDVIVASLGNDAGMLAGAVLFD